jgi:hypothetical protein
MKERSEKQTGQITKARATLDFVNYVAQEAILDPDLPDVFKDEFVNLAVDTIQKVAETKATYHAKYGEGRRTRKPR